MNNSCSQLEKKALVESLKGIVDELDKSRVCKPCCASGVPLKREKTDSGTGGSSPKVPDCKCRPKQERPSGKGDAFPCRKPQPPPPPVSGPAVVIPVLQTPHRIGRPTPLIVEPDYVRRENPEKYIIALPEPLRVRSRELIAGRMYHGCHCGKRDGLQDQCRRWDCRGYPYCCSNGLCKPSGGPGCDGTQCRKG